MHMSTRGLDVARTAKTIAAPRAMMACPVVGPLRGHEMTDAASGLGDLWWAKNLSEVDRELARLALICKTQLLDPGAIERVLANDASVCGTRNPLAFEKLRNLLMMHYDLRARAVDAIGEAKTQVVIAGIVEKLKEKFGDHLGRSAPG